MRPLFPTLLLPVAAASFTLCGAMHAADATPAPPPAPASDARPSAAAASPTIPAPASSASVSNASSAEPAPAPERMRPLSVATAARLAEQMPKFSPPETTPPPTSPILADTNPTPPPPDLRELDRPRNTILRLPNYVVQEEKLPVFKERHILTPRGHLALAFKRYPGLRFGSLPFFSNAGVALAMLEEDYRLERKAEMEDLVTLIADPTDRAKAKTEVQKTFLRSSLSGYDGMAPK